MTKQEALLRIAELEKLIKGFGTADADALHKVKAHIFAFNLSGYSDNYFREKLHSYGRWAEAGSSTRKFLSFAGGLKQVQTRALGDCSIMRSLIEDKWPTE